MFSMHDPHLASLLAGTGAALPAEEDRLMWAGLIAMQAGLLALWLLLPWA
ncbi:hypothetical protein [Rubellimicrobium arenae]|nr:hypothetical protein [Rubellimicrobium arenae]